MTTATASKPVEVLLVEDNPGDVRLTQEALKETTWPVHLSVARDGVEALEHLRNRNAAPTPDLILLDLNMPDTDGWKAFEVIARMAPDMPVIIITARPGQARRAAQAGIDMLLEKPLNIPVLLETIRSLLASPTTSSLARILRAWHTNDITGSQG